MGKFFELLTVNRNELDTAWNVLSRMYVVIQIFSMQLSSWFELSNLPQSGSPHEDIVVSVGRWSIK